MAIGTRNEGKYDGLFHKFRLGLQNWCLTGKEPKAGNQDIKYYLDLQEKRLQDHDLSMKLQMDPEEEIQSVHKISSNVPILGSGLSKFDQSLYVQQVTQTVSFSREGKSLFRKEEHLAMYQTILDPDTHDHVFEQSTYVCPNCGAISTLETLQDAGCPYCNTRYLMRDLYPKVTNYYFIDGGYRPERKWKSDSKKLVLLAVCGGVLQAVYSYFTDETLGLIGALLSVPFGALIWGIGLYLLWAMGFLVYAIFKAGKAVSLVGATAGSKKKLTQKLREFDPAFDYEYFEGKALSLARILMLSPDPDDNVQYEGPRIGDSFSDVVDIQYRGGIGVRSIKKNGDRIEVELDLYLTNTLDRGGRLSRKEEKIQLSMYHSADFPVDGAFSITKVQCHGCGGSFDARKEKNCPYCGQTYDAGLSDWVVTKIRR